MAIQPVTTTWKPSATVAAIIERDGRFLIVKEPRDNRIVLNQPAGHLEPQESLIEAVIREVKEETAWDFAPEFVTGIYQWHNPANEKTYMRTTFTGTVSNHDPEQTLFDGIISADWMTVDELQSSQNSLRSPMVLRSINDYLSGARYPLELLNTIE